MTYLDGISQYAFVCGACYFVAAILTDDMNLGFVALGQFVGSITAVVMICSDRRK